MTYPAHIEPFIDLLVDSLVREICQDANSNRKRLRRRGPARLAARDQQRENPTPI
jgi:hypothetical protein